jgi:hypothetical protein
VELLILKATIKEAVADVAIEGKSGREIHTFDLDMLTLKCSKISRRTV